MDDERVKSMEDKIEHLEFKLNLIFHESNINRLLFEYDITEKQYSLIMTLMDEIEEKINKEVSISNSEYETKLGEITEKEGDYHFAEYIARAFWEDERWASVFPYLYGDFPKYKHIINERDEK